MGIELLIKQFKEILEIEKNARDSYNYLIEKVKDPEARSVLESIRDDEEKHMKLASEAIEILKS